MVRPAILTPLGISVLALLNERPMHPYEMFQTLIQRGEDRIVKVRPGSLYHTVDRLADQSLLRAMETGRAGNRPERTIYEITDHGRAAMRDRIAEILGRPVNEYPLFPLALAESHNLGADEVVRLLGQRIETVDNDIAELDAMEQWATDHSVPKVYWLVLGYLRTMAAAEVSWLRELRGQVSSGELPWNDPEHAKLGTK